MQVRASDADRERVASALRDQCAVGRISLEELDERVGAAYAAATIEQLDVLVRDLPEIAPREAPRTRFFWPGIAPFHERRRLRARCGEAYRDALRVIVPRMGMSGFHLVDEVPPRRLQFAAEDGCRVTVMFHPLGSTGTELDAFGDAPRAVRKAFAQLRD